MKSKKGKVAAGCEHPGLQCGTCAGRAGSGDTDLVDFFRPVAPGPEKWPISLLRLCLEWQLLFFSF